ncbi:MAG TPA: hypothetical protein VJM34_01965 [Novosphingobium sp.]|nr:hypothetical protein [Novosphingobium sp.]
MNYPTEPRRNALSTVIAAALCLFSQACGGGGGDGIASTPGPLIRSEFTEITPLEPNPAWSSGKYDALAIDRSTGKVEPTGAFRLSVDAATKTYALTISGGSFPVFSATYDFTARPGEIPDGSRFRNKQYFANGSSAFEQFYYYQTGSYRESQVQPAADTRILTGLGISGPAPSTQGSLTPATRYTALGEWNMSTSKRQSDGTFVDAGQERSALIAFGTRTSASDIPTSGTARYAVVDDRTDYQTCEYYCNVADIKSTTNLTVDFTQRAIGAAYRWTNEESASGADGKEIGKNGFSVVATGRSPIDNAGSFLIDLMGSGSLHVTRNDGSILPDQSIPVDGQILGALFGPQAAEMGGVYRLPGLGVDDQGNLVPKPSIGAFTAVQSKP